jgi:hypothetical protein
VIVSYPFELENVANFTAWALTENGLKSSTVKSYLSSLATIHRLRNVSDENFSNYIVKTIVRGAENLALYGWMEDSDIECLKRRYPFLAEFSDTFIRTTGPAELMKMESTSIKMVDRERPRDCSPPAAPQPFVSHPNKRNYN